MITYINSAEAKLFEDAALALNTPSLSVEDYLKSLKRLSEISPKYVRLPLYEDGHKDEEIFEIDANARTIQIPASFKKNGVGVVSDEMAEILWFKINRYFDIKDFGAAAGKENSNELKDGDLHILVQWEAPDGEKGASWACFIDVDTDPEYIYFGWALTAEHLTAKPGNIKFAIRIMEYDLAGKIGYSFATQAAAVAVKANLSFDLTDEGIVLESVADKITSRFMDGPIAYCPVFKAGEGDDLYGGNLPLYIDNLDGDPAVAQLKVEADAPAGSSYDAMAYKWYHKGLNDDDFKLINPEDDNYQGQFTPALTVTSSGKYYVVVFGMREIVDNYEILYKGESEAVLYTAEEAAAELERATEAGEEPAFVEGDVKVPGTPILSDPAEKFKYHTSVASSQSNICEIPSPIALDILTDVGNLLVVTVEEYNLVMVISRQMVGEENNKRIVGQVELVAHKTATGEKIEGEFDDNAFIENVPILSAEDLEDPNAVGVYYEVDPEDTVIIHMDKAAEGYYKFEIINKLNGNQVSTFSGVPCRVVKPASIKSASIAIVGEHDGERGSLHNGNTLEVTVDLDGKLSDEIRYAWYIINTGKDPDDQEPDELIEGANGPVYMPTERGSYYAIVTNIVGSEENKAEIITNDVEFA